MSVGGSVDFGDQLSGFWVGIIWFYPSSCGTKQPVPLLCEMNRRNVLYHGVLNTTPIVEKVFTVLLRLV
jgi:hypothetical protein